MLGRNDIVYGTVNADHLLTCTALDHTAKTMEVKKKGPPASTGQRATKWLNSQEWVLASSSSMLGRAIDWEV